MGLTIKYQLFAPKTWGLEDIGEKLGTLREKCQELPFEGVDSELFEAERNQTDSQSVDLESSKQWFLIQARVTKIVKGDAPGTWDYYEFPSQHIIGFSTWPGEGCESANFGLVLAGARTTAPLLRPPPGWQWKSFCKTQYANNPDAGGLPNFLRSHLAVIAALDAARRLGFRVKVDDDGHY